MRDSVTSLWMHRTTLHDSVPGSLRGRRPIATTMWTFLTILSLFVFVSIFVCWHEYHQISDLGIWHVCAVNITNRYVKIWFLCASNCSKWLTSTTNCVLILLFNIPIHVFYWIYSLYWHMLMWLHILMLSVLSKAPGILYAIIINYYIMLVYLILIWKLELSRAHMYMYMTNTITTLALIFTLWLRPLIWEGYNNPRNPYLCLLMINFIIISAQRWE